MGKFHALYKLNTFVMDVAGAALTLKRLPYFLKNKRVWQKNPEMKDLRKSDTCYILGLGPSLRDVDVTKLDGDIFAVNAFFNYKDANLVKPTVYCVVDSFAYTNPNSQCITKAMDMFPDTAFLFNGLYRDAAVKKMGDRKRKCYFSCAWSGYFRPGKEIDFTKNLPVMGNVVGHVIMAAMYMGYKRIVLLGCDFNSFASRKQAHCYEHANNARALKLSYELFCYSFCADEHDLLAQYAKAHGIEIVNATNGSLIDAYPYDEALIQYFMK